MSAPTHVNGALLVYHRPALTADASTVREHIDAFAQHSKFPVYPVNSNLEFPPRLAEVEFDAIVLHYSLFGAGPEPYLLSQGFLDYLEGAENSYKLALFQDEMHWCQRRFAFLDRYGFDCVFTLIEKEYFGQTYGAYTNVPKIVYNIPGYVSDQLVEASSRYAIPDADRSIDIGYRGRPLPPHLGRGGMEKNEVGARFAELAADSGLKMDIDLTEEGRIYGDRWYRFIADCRGMLGSESGASCIDVEDEVLADAQRLEAAGDPVTIEALERGALGDLDWKIPYRMISPRHFEAAAFGVTQILYEGHYSGVMEPMEHYIPLKKDFSNLGEVLELFGDPEVRQRLTTNARRDLIDSGDYGYDRLVATFDQTLTEAELVPAPQSGALAKRKLRSPIRSTALLYKEAISGWLWRNHPIVFRTLWLPTRPFALARRGWKRLRQPAPSP